MNLRGSLLRKTWYVRALAALLLVAIQFGLTAAAASRPSPPEDMQAKFETANQKFRDGKFAEATRLYEELSWADRHQAVYYYNLANSLFRQGKRGLAILNYERTLLFDPWHADARENLSYVRSLLEYSVADKRNTYLRLGERGLKYFRAEDALLAFLFCFFLLLGSWLWVLFRHPGKPWGPLRKFLFVLTLLSLGFYGAKHVQTNVYREAVVVVKEAKVRFGPSVQDKVAFRLGEGLRVFVLDRRENWSRIVLENGDGGWTENTDITEVRV